MPVSAGRPAGASDVHIHVQPGSSVAPDILALLLEGRADAEAIRRYPDDPQLLLAAMDRLGLRRAGLIAYASSLIGSSEELNDWVCDYAAGDPQRLLPFVGPEIGRGDPSPRIRELAARGARGLKIHPPHSGIPPNIHLAQADHPLARLYATAQKLRLPVAVHTGTSVFAGARSRLGDPLLLDDVAVDFPELTLIAAHCGRPLWYDAAVFLARRHANVYLDVSSIPARRLTAVLPRLSQIAHKVLYGSDWPGPGVPTLEECLDAFWACDLPPEAKRRILVDNAEMLFG
ncbi:MAG: amidohydrolase family protein [Candidatus Eisenbacteria bacterium]|nr:amidohydrolase family protein [Candidatus Eisenbacteria bacterium]